MGKKSPDANKGEPSLELPHFSLRGRSRKKQATEQATGQATEQASVAPRPEPEEEAPTAVLLVEETQRDGFSLPAMPAISGPVAAIATGMVVGAFGTGMTYLAMAGCEGIRGASTCGRSGFFPLVAILALMILLGAVMLRFAKVSDPGSTSFLAVALLGVIALLTLTDVIFSGWMFLIVPILCAPAYALAHWVTTKFVEEPDRPEDHHDLR